MKRVGVITHYYNSLNYGGVLQAYALCKVLEQMGMVPEQICIPAKGQRLPWQAEQMENKLAYFLKEGMLLRKVHHRLKRTVQKRIVKMFVPDLRKKRVAAFSHFVNDLVPHSSTVYDNGSIGQCNDRYDIFITGSDQVWNLRWYHPAYFLEFAHEHKPKFAYGVSMAMNSLSAQEQELIRHHLRDYLGVSVREKQGAELLRDVAPQSVEVVLDPTLLLTQQQWDEICAPRLIEEEYVFCYFLSNNRAQRKRARDYAKAHKLKLVTIPYMDHKYVHGDASFGDIRLPAPSPEEFLSLIKHAACVFTDSFHAAVFSSLYQKEYFVFSRGGNQEMDSRIYDLTALFGTQTHFCNDGQKIKPDYVLHCERLDYSVPAPQFAAMKERSVDYLTRMLDTAKDTMINDEK